MSLQLSFREDDFKPDPSAAGSAQLLAEVQAHVARGAHVDDRDESALTALQWAAIRGATEAAAFLLDHGAVIDRAEPRHGWSALHFAGQECRVEMIALLLARGASPKLFDQQGHSPLGRVTSKNRFDNRRAQWTSLHDLAAAGATVTNPENYACVEAAIVVAPLDPIWGLLRSDLRDSQTGFGVTSLHIACGLGDEKTALALLERGARGAAPAPCARSTAAIRFIGRASSRGPRRIASSRSRGSSSRRAGIRSRSGASRGRRWIARR